MPSGHATGCNTGDSLTSGATVAVNGVDLDTDYTLGGPLRNKLSRNVRAQLERDAAELEKAPLTLLTAGDTECAKLALDLFNVLCPNYILY